MGYLWQCGSAVYRSQLISIEEEGDFTVQTFPWQPGGSWVGVKPVPLISQGCTLTR